MRDRVVAIVLARMTSTRLPGKALAELGPKTVLGWAIDRARQAKRVDEIVVATTYATSDDRIVETCDQFNVRHFRGSEHDVLCRFTDAAECFDAHWAIRINADNPFIDPAYLDSLVVRALSQEHEYISYHLADDRPVMLATVGFFGEIISHSCLARARELITNPFEREHVTLGIYRRPQDFRVEFLSLPALFDRPYLRFTLDTPHDLQLLREIVGAIGNDVTMICAEDLVRLVEGRKEWQEAMSAQNVRNPKSMKQ